MFEDELAAEQAERRIGLAVGYIEQPAAGIVQVVAGIELAVAAEPRVAAVAAEHLEPV